MSDFEWNATDRLLLLHGTTLMFLGVATALGTLISPLSAAAFLVAAGGVSMYRAWGRL